MTNEDRASQNHDKNRRASSDQRQEIKPASSHGDNYDVLRNLRAEKMSAKQEAYAIRKADERHGTKGPYPPESILSSEKMQLVAENSRFMEKVDKYTDNTTRIDKLSQRIFNPTIKPYLRTKVNERILQNSKKTPEGVQDSETPHSIRSTDGRTTLKDADNIAKQEIARPADKGDWQDINTSEINVRHFQPESPEFVRDFKMADVLDFKTRVDQFHSIIKEKKSPEEALRIVHFLQREPEAIQQFQQMYSEKYGQSAQAALKRHMGGEAAQLSTYGLHLLQGKQYNTKELVSHQDEEAFQSLINDIHQSVENGQKGELYARLTPFRRNTPLLAELRNTYEEVHGISLDAHLSSKLSGKSLEFARYLAGDTAMEESATPHEAQRLVSAFAGLKITTNYRVTRNELAHERIVENCHTRTYAECEAAAEGGWSIGKMFVASYALDEKGSKKSTLSIETNFADDAPLGEVPPTSWAYHVAPYIGVKASPEGSPLGYIIDPSVSPHRVSTLNEWVGKMNTWPYTNPPLTFSEMHTKMDKNNTFNGFPTDKAYVFQADRFVYRLPKTSKEAQKMTRDRSYLIQILLNRLMMINLLLTQ